MAVAKIAPRTAVRPLNAREPGRSPIFLRRGLVSKAATASVLTLIILILTAICADLLNGYTLQGYQHVLGPNQPAYAKQVLQDNYARPGQESESPHLEGFVYWFGADNLGRDLWSRTLYGTRVSLAVAIVAGSVSLILGLTYGLIAGYNEGQIDNAMMRLVDFLYGLPMLIIIILAQVYLKSWQQRHGEQGVVKFLSEADQALGGMLFVFVVLGALSWLSMARIARGQTLSTRRQEYVEAAVAVGAKPSRVIFRQILPNILGPCIVQLTLQIPNFILIEAFLSFIGLGVNAPLPSWGIMINEAFPGLRSHPHAIIPPALALTVAVLAFNFLGDGLRDALDPQLRK